MTHRADPALDARLATLVDGLPAGAAPSLSELEAVRPYRTPRWVLVLVAVLLLVAAIVAFLLVGGRSADAYSVSVPAALDPRMTAAEAATQVTELLAGSSHIPPRTWPSDEPIPSPDIISVTAAGGGGSITWTIRACGPFVANFGPPGWSTPSAATTTRPGRWRRWIGRRRQARVVCLRGSRIRVEPIDPLGRCRDRP